MLANAPIDVVGDWLNVDIGSDAAGASQYKGQYDATASYATADILVADYVFYILAGDDIEAGQGAPGTTDGANVGWVSLGQQPYHFEWTSGIFYPGGVLVRRLGKLYATNPCLLYTSPSPRDRQKSRMPSSA